MKRVILWLLGAFSLLFSIFVGLCFFDPLMAGILTAEIAGTRYGHPRHPPALAEGVDVSSVQPNDKAEQNWNLIVTRHFPKGSRVQDMLTILRGQGFTVMSESHAASYDWGGMPCLYTARVIWSEDTEQRISAINGRAGSGCL